MARRLEGKIAIVTGSASGQGLAEARLFATEGAWVAMADRDASANEAAAHAIGERVTAFRHDVTDADDWQALVTEVLRRFGRVDILINNAGVYRPRSFLETDVAAMDLHYRVNVLGTFMGMKAVVPAMVAQKRGAIVNVSSGAGLRGYPGMLAYTGSKWMVRGVTKSAAADLARTGIRVNVLLPGAIDTPMLSENPPEVLEAFTAAIPIQRLGTPSEIAEAALFLASDAASYITGADLAVCGGLSA